VALQKQELWNQLRDAEAASRRRRAGRPRLWLMRGYEYLSMKRSTAMPTALERIDS
jgi:hypothetical protein